MNRILLFLLFIPFVSHSQDSGKSCDVLIKINKLIQHEHFNPKPVDDSLSVYVFNTVMEELDDNKSLFLQQEYDKLAIHKTKIDDYVLTKDCSFFNDFIASYRNALQRKRDYVAEISKEQLPYDTKDTIYYSKKTFPFHTDPERIKKFLRKKITFDILEDVAKLSKHLRSTKRK